MEKGSVFTPTGMEILLDCPAGAVSDGYHTFDELYAHRCKLFALLLTVIDVPGVHPFKTLRNGEGIESDGWFIAGMDTMIGQITYHLPIAMWDSLPVSEIEQNDKYDRHTSAIVLARLDTLLKEWV